MNVSFQRKMKVSTIQRGFSTLELLVVLGLLAVMLLVTIPALYRLLQSYRLQSAVNVIATNLRFARGAALKQKIPYRLTFRDRTEAEPNTYIIEYDPGRSGSFQLFESLDTSIPKGVTIEPASLDQVTFDSRGASSTSGFVLVKGVHAAEYKVTVSLIGSVNVEK